MHSNLESEQGSRASLPAACTSHVMSEMMKAWDEDTRTQHTHPNGSIIAKSIQQANNKR